MDTTALFNLSYGLYIVGTKDEGTDKEKTQANAKNRNVGCVVNSAFQISSTPSTIALSINKNNYTTDCILKKGGYTLSILSENARKELIGGFGFSSSRDKDKYEGVKAGTTESGLPYIEEGACSYLELKVINHIECFTHIVIFAEIVDAKNLSKEPPMTYSYYHKVVKGTAPKNAPTYIDPEKLPKTADSGESKYVCSVCKYEYTGTAEEFENLPDSYVCPICGQPKSVFKKS